MRPLTLLGEPPTGGPVQGISDDEVPWYELVIPLMVGTETLSLAKCLLMVWRWSIKVVRWGICPPTLAALNIGQFMTKEEVSEDVDEPLWFAAYSCTLQQVGEAAHGRKWEWPVGNTPEECPPGPCLLGGNWHQSLHGLHQTLLGAPPQGVYSERGRGAL